MHMSCSVFLWFQAEDGIRDAQESRGLKQKTAYEMLRSLVGSEMCIRDRPCGRKVRRRCAPGRPQYGRAVSYTHLTLPDEEDSVDLGGRRIIKKKKKEK